MATRKDKAEAHINGLQYFLERLAHTTPGQELDAYALAKEMNTPYKGQAPARMQEMKTLKMVGKGAYVYEGPRVIRRYMAEQLYAACKGKASEASQRHKEKDREPLNNGQGLTSTDTLFPVEPVQAAPKITTPEMFDQILKDPEDPPSFGAQFFQQLVNGAGNVQPKDPPKEVILGGVHRRITETALDPAFQAERIAYLFKIAERAEKAGLPKDKAITFAIELSLEGLV